MGTYNKNNTELGSYFKNNSGPRPDWAPSFEYQYQTAEGYPASVARRWEMPDGGKRFAIEHFVGYGNAEAGGDGWEDGFGPAGRLLYRLPELIAADPTETLHLAEGEKVTDYLVALGLVATTNPNGYRGWHKDFAKYFKGRNVVIHEDNDEAGRERTKRALKDIRKVAKSVQVVRFEDWPEGSDAIDFLEAGNSLADLLARIESPYRESEFERDKNGKVYPSQRNVRLALDLMGIDLTYDEFQDRELIDGLPGFGPALSDAAVIRLKLQMEERFHLSMGKDSFYDLISDQTQYNRFHPVREYLGGLVWDETPRLDTWLIDYAGAKDTDYVRAVSSIILIAAVRRIREPGCKFDEMLILESGQGKSKSSALAVLAKRPDWFSDDLPLNADSQKVIERIAGKWIVEAAELKGMRKGEVEHMKSFLSRQIDRARMAYGRKMEEHPRQCVFIGTDNSGNYLRDGTGNRRFWPVTIEEFDLSALRRDVDQLWAEAAAREANGESIRLAESLWAVAAEEQEERRVEDPYVDDLGEVFGSMDGDIRTTEVWAALGLSAAMRTQEQNARVGSAMKALGFARTKRRFGNDVSWVYRRGESKRQIIILSSPDGRTGKAYFEDERPTMDKAFAF